MRLISALFALPLLALLLLARPAPAQDTTLDAMKQQMDWMKEQMDAMAAQIRDLQEQLAARGVVTLEGADEYYIPRLATEFQQSGQPPLLGNIYTKPFLADLGERVHWGGYINTQFTSSKGSEGDKNFDLAPFVPFIYAVVSDRVKIASEIEVDHGHEFEIEFAQMDYLFNPAFNFRAGVQLLPVGKLNEVHDAPIQDLSERPLVDQLVIPTTLRDVGIGFWGAISEQVSYQTTITNGFRGLASDGTVAINLEEGMHDAAPHEDGIGEPFEQINDTFAYAGRLAYKPVLGVELGGSALIDQYDENGHNDLRILALDATVDGKAVGFLPDQMELLGEAAWDSIERDDFAVASGVPNDFNGYYVQANYHFDPECISSWKTKGWVEEEAHFTFVTRYDRVHLDTYDRRRTTFGLNFRPNAHDTVFKLDYQINSDSGTLEGDNDHDALVLSMATYF